MNTENFIYAGYALPGAGMTSQTPSYDYASLLGKTAVLKPWGENIFLDANLPKSGILVRQISLTDWGDDWLVMAFQEPLRYKEKNYFYCLIRSRWSVCPIGSEFCPVFVLLDANDSISNKDHWTSSDFQFVSWNEVEMVNNS